MRKILGLVALLPLLAAPALAQSPPSPPLYYGFVPTAGQWNQFFAAKQDYLGFTPLNPANIAGASPVTVTPSGGIITIGLNVGVNFNFTAAQTINLTGTTAPATIAATALHAAAASGQVARVQASAFGAISSFTGAIYGGTPGSPTQVTSGTQLTELNAYAYTGTALVGPIVSFRTYSSENIGASAWGSRACLATTPQGTTTLADGLCQQPSGGLTVGVPAGGDKGVGTLNASANVYVNNVPVLTGNQTITLSGDVTGSGATAITTTLANIPNDVPVVGDLLITLISAPSAPASGKVRFYADVATGRITGLNNGGGTMLMVVPQSATSNQFVTNLAANGTLATAQPSFSNLSGSATCAQLPALTGDATTSAGSCAVTVAKINGVTLGTTTATAGNLLIGSGSQWVTQAITGAVSLTSGGVTALTSSAFANPANPGVNLTGANGSATTALRSDAVLILDQSIAPTWTGQHIHNVARTIASATAATLRDLYVQAATTTITGNTGSPITQLSKVYVGQPTLTDSSAVTVTDSDSLYVDNSPLAAGSVTITNAWAIRVGAGNVKFPGTGNVLGTITSGTWNGTAIAIANGGTNNTSAYTAGSIIYSDGTKLTQNNASLYWDNSNGRICINIGSAGCTFAMSVIGVGQWGASVSGAGIRYQYGGTTSSGTVILGRNYNNDTFNSIGFSTTGNDDLVVATSGNVTARLALTVGTTLTVSGMASNTGAQTGYVCYNSGTGLTTYDPTNTCLVSSIRFKTDVRPITPREAINAVLAIRPVTYRYDRDFLPTGVRAGFIAEQVATLADGRLREALVGYDGDGLPLNVRESFMPSILVGAIQELRESAIEAARELRELRRENAELRAQVRHARGGQRK